MRISWFSFARIAETASGLASSSASARYRIILPTRELRARGHEVTVHCLRETIARDRSEDFGKADVAVIGKLLGDGQGNYGASRDIALQLALEAAQRGTRIIADLTDDHFDHPLFLDFYRRLARMGAEFVASSDVLAKVVADTLSCDATVIGDPFEGPHGIPGFPEMGKRIGRWRPRDGDAAQTAERALRVLWFGHPANVPEITSEAPRLARFARSRRVELRVLTVPSDSLKAWCSIANRFAEDELSISVELWSQDGLWSALESCDAVVLPTEILPAKKLARSANRLIETLRAGRFAIAHPVPSYLEFRDFAWIGEDLCEGIGWALARPESAKERILRGQAYVQAQYSPAAIGESWEVLLETAKPPVPPSADTEAAEVPAGPRLHLGCGDKLLAGYINVDAVARAGVTPDVVCDVRDLKAFQDHFADEILSVHVIEHFYRWEVEALLKEWLRVLRPGGRMVIECPNLVSACERYLDLAKETGHGEREPQRTMWVFYGDPRWKDPLMAHRWGYSPEGLAQLMRSVGLVNVRQEPAQFKLREPRDMRLVGEKPRN